MENINYVLYRFLGLVLFLTAVTLLYQVDERLNQSITTQIKTIHEQKALVQK